MSMLSPTLRVPCVEGASRRSRDEKGPMHITLFPMLGWFVSG
jgi:hypothetical protein